MNWEHPKDDRTALRVVAFFLGLCAVGYLAYLVLPASVPHPRNPSIWSTVLDNRWFLESVRTVLVIAGVYIFISMLALVWDGTWLHTFGPVSAESKKKLEINKSNVEFLATEADRLTKVAQTEHETAVNATLALENAVGRIKSLEDRIKLLQGGAG